LDRIGDAAKGDHAVFGNLLAFANKADSVWAYSGTATRIRSGLTLEFITPEAFRVVGRESSAWAAVAKMVPENSPEQAMAMHSSVFFT
jgi:hypothetical protein